VQAADIEKSATAWHFRDWHRKVATGESEDALLIFACSMPATKSWALRERVHAGGVFPKICRVQTT
jgi:hypothetical protein